jgi:hypothetical protein
MDCKDIKLKLHDLVDDRFTFEKSKNIKRHLRVCPSCAGEYKFLQFVKKSIGSIPYKGLSAGFNAAVMTALGIKPVIAGNLLLWTFAVCAVAILCWVSGAVTFLFAKYGYQGLLGVWEFAADPAQIFASAGIWLGRLAVYVKQTLKVLDTMKLIFSAGLSIKAVLAFVTASGIICTGLAGYFSAKTQKSAVKTI